jgi:periplasmic protein TonB
VAALLGGAIWRVPALAEPRQNVAPLSILLPPPPAPAAPAARPPQSSPAAVPRAPQPPPLSQPRAEIPDLPQAPLQVEPLPSLEPARDGPLPAGPITPGGDGPGDPRGSGERDRTGETFDARIDARIHNPEIIPGTRLEPRYTEQARRVRLEGTVVLAAVVDERGQLVELRALKALPLGLTEAALDAVRQWRFRPATLLGKPVRAAFNLTINFHCR